MEEVHHKLEGGANVALVTADKQQNGLFWNLKSILHHFLLLQNDNSHYWQQKTELTNLWETCFTICEVFIFEVCPLICYPNIETYLIFKTLISQELDLPHGCHRASCVTWNPALPAGRPLCPGSVRRPPARCSSSSVGWVRSPGLGPIPERDARPHVASWRSTPPTPPDSAPPCAAAPRTPASSPPTPSERWPAKEGTYGSIFQIVLVALWEM